MFLRDLRKGHDFPRRPPWQAAEKKKRISWRKNPALGISKRGLWISPYGEDQEPDHAGDSSFLSWTSSRPRPASFVWQSFLEVSPRAQIQIPPAGPPPFPDPQKDAG